MESVVQQLKETTKSDVKRLRWALGINGVASIAFAAVVLIWPNISLSALVLLFGAFSFANGIVTLGMAISSRVKDGRGWLVLSGVAGIAVGVLVFLWPGMSALAFLYVIGAYAITLGIIAIGGAFWLPLDGADRALLFLEGVVSILFGIVMFAEPSGGALVLLALIAAFALVRGISELVIAIGWQKLLERQLKRSLPTEPKLQPTV
jgi:uncharacterized membrane protein HdeD (DUF308 family)